MVLLALFLAWALSAAPDPPLPAIPVQLALSVPAAEPVRGVLRVVPEAGEPQELDIVVPGEAHVQASGPATFSVEAVGFWAEPQPFRGGAEPVTLTLRPASFLQGHLQVPRGYGLPESVDVRLQTSRRPQGAASRPEGFDVVCPLSPQGKLSCTVPAGTFDLRIKAKGFAASYQWAVTLPPGKAVTLKTAQLQPGASIVGWLEVEDGSALSESARVTAEHLASAVEVARGHGGLRELQKEARTGPSGFFQIEGLEAGTYWLVGAQEGYAPAPAVAVETYEGLETLLREPILLRRAVTLDLQLEPHLDPQGKPWRIRLVPAAGNAQREIEGEADPSGAWIREGLPRGRFDLEIESRRGDRWYAEELDLQEEVEARWLGLHGVVVEGRVLLRDEPVEAHLWFGGAHGSPRVHRYANDEGEFWGVLPRAGEWKLSVELADHPGTRLRVDPIEVKEAEGGDSSRLTIRLPAGRVSGVVIDEAGTPVPQVPLTLRFAGEKKGTVVQETRSETDGTFELPAVEAGRVRITPDHRQLLGDTVEIDLAEGGTVAGVEVVVYEPSWLEGRVLGDYGPVPGAQVVVFPRFPLGQDRVVGDAARRTEVDGTFRFPFPRSAQEVTVVVFAPGYAVRILSVAPGSPEVEIPLSREGGTLELEIPSPEEEAGTLKRRTLLVEDRHLPPFLFDAFWGRLHGGSGDAPGQLVLPMMEPGEYGLCSGDEGSALAARRCVFGTLGAGETLTLAAP